jgi:2-polyprenyl-3-methyl-5-hydroxy-6-metoxy-1,4-benzoquinol methylase/uncharacterized protein YbaR (Trm112 family)
MRPALLDRLVCPRCHGSLDCCASSTAADGDILAGRLDCAPCRASYPIERGIPRFVPQDNYASSFGYQWNLFRREQIDTLNGTGLTGRRWETETAWDAGWLNGKWILDGGCGAGRFLDVVSRNRGCDVVGVDMSNAVDAVREMLSDRPNVHLVQASLFELPFRPATFDGVYCIGVIQHTPDPRRAVESVAAMVRPGGRLALTMYERRRFTKWYSKYWFRPVTRHMRPERLLTLIKVTMPVAFAISEVLFRVPVLAKVFRAVLPVANYVDIKELSLRQRYQWAILDTFDMLAPAYDSPQRQSDVVATLTASGIADIRRQSETGLNLVGIKGTTEPRA